MTDQPPVSANDRMRPEVEREYRTDQIVVYWEPKLCIHTGNCLRGLHQVFNIRRRPWVNVEAASPDQIAEVIQRCPTGALRFERLDGGPQETAPEETIIEAQPDGPLYVHGRVRVVDQDGATRELTRAALCRCGASLNKPFCDNTHRKVGFKSS